MRFPRYGGVDGTGLFYEFALDKFALSICKIFIYEILPRLYRPVSIAAFPNADPPHGCS